MSTSTIPPPPPATAERHPGLDGLRGIAIISVMVFHFMLITSAGGGGRLDGYMDEVTGIGWAGVDLFFVLSGFLITGILLRSKERGRHYFRDFYARRALRIFPLYYAFLAVMLVAIPLVIHPHSVEYHDLERSQAWFWLYLNNIWVALRHGQITDLEGTGHLWSLAVEEQFYLVWPAVVMLCSRRALAVVAALVVVAAWALRAWLNAGDTSLFVTYTLTLTRMDALAAGALLALLMADPRGRRAVARWSPPCLVAGAVWMAGVVAVERSTLHLDPTMQTFGLTPLAFLFAALIGLELTASAPAIIHSVTRLPFLRSAGRYSYAAYVFHWPIVTWLAYHAGIVEFFPHLAGSTLPGRVALAVTAATITFAAAWLSWRLFESPILGLRRLLGDDAPAAAPATGLTLLRPSGTHDAPSARAA